MFLKSSASLCYKFLLAFYRRYLHLRCLWIFDLKQKQKFTAIHHYIPIYHHIVHTGVKQHVLLHLHVLVLQKILGLKQLQENTCRRTVQVFIKLTGYKIIQRLPNILRKWLILYDKLCRHIPKHAFFV